MYIRITVAYHQQYVFFFQNKLFQFQRFHKFKQTILGLLKVYIQCRPFLY